MQVTRATYIPLLVPARSDRVDPGAVREEFLGDLTVVYTYGPQFGRRVVTHADLEQTQLAPQVLRRSALEHLEVLASRAEFHGQPPALMLSFEGLESSLLLATDIWHRLEGAVPGELVVGVPARDVVVVTGSNSSAGLEKARRCVERVFFAGDENLLSRTLLVRRGNGWEPFDRPAGARAPRGGFAAHHRGPDQPPRQYQEHPSWPGERVPVARPPMRPMAPAAQFGMPPAAPGLQRPAHTGGIPAVGHGTAPHHTGGIPAVGHGTAPHHTGGIPAVGRGMAPHHTGGIPAVSHGTAPHHTGSIAPVSAPVHHTGTMRPVHTGPIPAVGAGDATPYSAVPYSAIPASAIPYSAMPNSASPYAPAPHAASEYLQSRGVDAKPPYRDDMTDHPVSDTPNSYSGGYERYDDDLASHGGHGAEQPAYPASWGEAPGTPSRPEFRTGPRARFSR